MILDIGCGDGSLLEQMPPSWQRLGIEENPDAVAAATTRGIDVVASDLGDQAMRRRLAGKVSLVTAIGVLERVPDLRMAMLWASELLADDGLMLFEVPVLRETGLDDVWLDARLGIIWYPTRASMERLVRDELGLYLAGAECVVEGYATTFVGLIAKGPERAKQARDLVDRVLTGPLSALQTHEERRVRALYQSIHAADTSQEGRELLRVLREPDGLPAAARRRTQDRATSVDADVTIQATEGLKHQLQELRAEIARGQVEDGERYEGLRAEIARGQVEDGERYEGLRAEIARGLGRIGRLQRDSLSHRVARRARGTAMVVRQSTDRHGAKAILDGARVLIAPAARRAWMDLFDADEYLDAYEDVVKANVPASLHYLLLGHQEGREPSSRFSGTAYLAANRDVAEAGLNPLVHYSLRGRREGRSVARPTPDQRGRRSRQVNSLWPRESPLVSVVIPCFNYGRHLRNAVGSVLAQTWEDLEIVVVEGGSTDSDSVMAVRELEAEQPPSTTFYYRDGRRLVGDNRNFGISRARGRYIVCLDADDALEPVYLEVALFLAEAYQYDLVYPSVQCHGESDATWLVQDTSFKHLLEWNAIPTVALFRRSAWVEAGGYRDWGVGDSHVPEDWAFWVRLVGMGYRPKAIPQPLMRYHVHAGSLSATAASDMERYRRSVKAANADLLDAVTAGEAVADPALAINPYCNLQARKPTLTDHGSVLIAMPYATIGGAERLMASLGKSLVADEYRVIVTTSLLAPETMPSGAPLFRAAFDQVYDLPLLFTERSQQEAFFLHLLQRYQVRTLIIAGSRFAYELLPEIRRLTHGIGIVDQLFNAVGHSDSHREFAPFLDLAIVPSVGLRTRLMDEWKVPTEVSVIPHAVPTSGVEHNRPTVGQSERADRPRIIGYFGRWSEEKGPDLFVEIARTVASGTDATFVMTGDGPMREQVNCLIRQYQLTDRIRTPGFVPEAASLMAEVDVVVIPSRLDGMPLVVLEAMALGKPVVASAVGSIPEVIDAGRTGFLCQPGDITAFAAQVLALARDRGLRDRIRHGCAAGLRGKLLVGTCLPPVPRRIREGIDARSREDRRIVVVSLRVQALRGRES